MYKRSKAYSVFLITTVLVVFVSGSGCFKEYSYEKSIKKDSIINEDPIPPPGFPSCASCIGKDSFLLGKWSFKIDSIVVCGNITNGVINPERTLFTFFGPSACSEDTGIIMTVSLNGAALNADQTGLRTERSIFQYYHRGAPDVFLSRPVNGFTFTVNQYTHQSGIASGTFSGKAASPGGDIVEIHDGKYKIQFQ